MKIIVGDAGFAGCTQDGFLYGHYRATYANGSTLETWAINNGKVTTGDRVGHYCGDNKGHYLQTPIKIRFLKNLD